MGAIARRMTEHQVLTGALLLAGAVFLVYPLSTNVLGLLALSFILGLGLGSSQPMVLSLLHTHAPPGRIGEAAGVRLSLVNMMSVGRAARAGRGRRIGRDRTGVLVRRHVPDDVRFRRAPRRPPRDALRASGYARRFSRSVKCLRNFATLGATTTVQYGCPGFRAKYS